MKWTVTLAKDGSYVNVHCGYSQKGSRRLYVEAGTMREAERLGRAAAEQQMPVCRCGRPAGTDGMTCLVCRHLVTAEQLALQDIDADGRPKTREPSASDGLLALLLEVQEHWIRGTTIGVFSKYLQHRIDGLRPKPAKRVAPLRALPALPSQPSSAQLMTELRAAQAEPPATSPPKASELPGQRIRPLHKSYYHTRCGTHTGLSDIMAESFACFPTHYTESYCCECSASFDLKSEEGRFLWPDGRKVGE